MTRGLDERQPILGDWITIWHSEMSAAATDRERAETWSVSVAAWADWARAWAGAGRADGSAGSATTAAPTGAAPSANAPDAGSRTIAELVARVDELERRLANPGSG